MRVKNSNPFFIIIALVIIAVIFVSYYAMIPVNAKLYNKLYNNTRYSSYHTESSCKLNGGIWEGSSCLALPSRAGNLFQLSRNVWLTVGIFFAISLIIWVIVSVTRKDPRQYYI